VTFTLNHYTSTLGLAEWCNGNFLGARHLYAEYYSATTNDIRYYPYPSRNHSTDYLQKSANLALGMQALTLRNGQQGQAIYLNKTDDGVVYPDISRFTYFGAKFPRFGMMTINDDNVLSNYHDIFIPKAVEYCAGLLDYFFRGMISASVIGYDTNLMQYTNLIVNTSSQSFGSGTFSLYQDDASTNRTLLAYTNWSGILPTNGSLVMLFPPPDVPTNKLLLVFQGAIGVNGGGVPLDPVDTNIAIAATTFYPNVIWHNSFESDVGNITPGAGDIFCGGWLVESGSVDVGANGTWGYGLSTAYEGNYLLDLDGSEPGTISTNIATVLGQTYRLSFVWCRNPDSIEGVLGDTNHVPSAEVLINNSVVMTLVGDMENSWLDLQWQQASYTFTATGLSTELKFQSTSGNEDSGSISGIQLDAVYLYSVP